MSAEYIAFDRAFSEEYVLQVHAGQATAPDGITRVQVDGAGNFEATQYAQVASGVPDREQKGREPDRVEGRISPDEAEKLFELASVAPWGRHFPQRPGIPDEAIVDVRLERKGRESARMKLWLRDAEKDSVIGPILKELRRHLKEFSGGRIYL